MICFSVMGFSFVLAWIQEQLAGHEVEMERAMQDFFGLNCGVSSLQNGPESTKTIPSTKGHWYCLGNLGHTKVDGCIPGEGQMLSKSKTEKTCSFGVSEKNTCCETKTKTQVVDKSHKGHSFGLNKMIRHVVGTCWPVRYLTAIWREAPKDKDEFIHIVWCCKRTSSRKDLRTLVEGNRWT